MSDHPKQPDIVERLREAIREGAGQLAEDCIVEIERLRSLALDDARFDAAQLSRENVAMADERVALRAALIEAERFLDYFANGHTTFVGRGTPNSALAMVRAAIEGDPGCLRSPAPTEDGEGLREALVRIEIITASGRTDELLGKMKTINSLAHSALSSGRDGRKP